MQMKPRVPLQPPVDLGVLVRAVVIQDQMHLQARGNLAVDGVEEPQELGVAVPGQALADHRAGQTSRAANSVVVPLRL